MGLWDAMIHNMVGRPIVSDEHAASIFRIEGNIEDGESA
jgi:hypothetical protein